MMGTSVSEGSVHLLDTPPSHIALATFCSTGDLDSTRVFFEATLPSLRPEQRISYCSHAGPKCHNTPCPSLVTNLCETAARSNHANIFAYLWDTFLSSNEEGAVIIRIPWQCLRSAAILGSLSLAEAFFSRDSDCFRTVAPPAAHGMNGGASQISIAIRHDRFDYIDYMLAHGADIDMSSHKQNILRGVMNSAIDDGKPIVTFSCRLPFPSVSFGVDGMGHN